MLARWPRRWSTGNQAGDGFTDFMELCPRLHSISDKFFFWKAVGSMIDTFDMAGAFCFRC